MRIHASDGDALRAHVYLDGVEIHQCIEADDAEGWVRIYATYPDGSFKYARTPAGPEFEFVVRHGRVEIKIERAASQ